MDEYRGQHQNQYHDANYGYTDPHTQYQQAPHHTQHSAHHGEGGGHHHAHTHHAPPPEAPPGLLGSFGLGAMEEYLPMILIALGILGLYLMFFQDGNPAGTIPFVGKFL